MRGQYLMFRHTAATSSAYKLSVAHACSSLMLYDSWIAELALSAVTTECEYTFLVCSGTKLYHVFTLSYREPYKTYSLSHYNIQGPNISVDYTTVLILGRHLKQKMYKISHHYTKWIIFLSKNHQVNLIQVLQLHNKSFLNEYINVKPQTKCRAKAWKHYFDSKVIKQEVNINTLNKGKHHKREVRNKRGHYTKTRL